MDGLHAPTNPDTDARDKRVSACLREYHTRQAAGEPVEAAEFAARLDQEEFDFFDTLVDMDGLLEDPAPSINHAALPRTFGEYTLLREVGNGATGVVYEAVEHGLRRSVAIKVLRASFGDDDIVRERFLREADACSQIDHPNVVTVHRSGEAEGHPFYAMTYVDGLPLSKMLGTNLIDVRDVCSRAAEVADALGEIHDAGIIHRDVKPGNIMQAPDGKWILTDFGHVRNDSALTLTKSGDALGTPLYMSPEQARGVREIDGRTDIYGLGATLYHLLTGTPVFAADNLQGLMRAVLMDRAESMRGRMIDMPSDLDRVVLKCLEKRPEDRYASMAELADDLRAIAEGRSAVGRPVTRTQRTLRWIPQNPGRIAAAALIALGFVWAMWLRTETPYLNIETLDGATVAVLGHDDRLAPVSDPIALEIGNNQFTVSREGFRTRTVKFPAKSGGEYHYARFALAPEDPDDESAQTMMLAFLGVLRSDAPTLMADGLQRSGGTMRSSGKPLTTIAVYPRGKITRAELDESLVSVGDEYDTAEVVWMKGDKELARKTLDPATELEKVAIPVAVREALQIGDVLRWKIVDGTQTVASAEATIVAHSAVIAKLDQDLSTIPMTDLQVRQARTRGLLEEGFLAQALREARGDGESDSLMLASYRVILLQKLCKPDGKRLKDSKIFGDATHAPQKLSAKRAPK